MKKEIKILILVSVIFIVIMVLITSKARYYLREGDIIMVAINMEKVEHALNSWSIESSGRFPQSLDEKTEETNEPFETFLLKEDWYEPPILPFWEDKYSPVKKRLLLKRENWYKPLKYRFFHKVVNFKPLTDTIPGRILPCRMYILTDGVRYKIVGGDKNGFLVPEDISQGRGASKPKIIYSDNYWENELGSREQ
jgi:hypothetical protein